MKHWLHRIEIFIDSIIPLCLLVLLAIVVFEVGFGVLLDEYLTMRVIISIFDFLILFVFIMDLIFKYMRVKTVPEFLRKYWLEIIAVLPFFLVLRLFEFFTRVIEISRGARLLSIERSTKLLKYTKPLSEVPRFLKTIPLMIHFYEAPSMHKHAE